MKTIITSSGNITTAVFDKRFGRAAWFCIYDEQTGEAEFIENVNLNASNGAGTKAAEKAIELNVKKIISGDFGPKAKELLDKFEIQMVILQDDNLTIENIIKKLKN
ncbi:NifB/NifX family molybdenum-iron cluster-binding protein [Plebeiibacterium marinum]|uniref:Dinitrogenase iron-molybdenum cofactor biosynthesis protein n=1 Tax=Plebeiibacterium marinum TaxID=2992111 RepID=A0AAE3MFR9_9BACT|nr:NifB/NifX family molybdenum-iron cluster-binding protein [Plebeiobacterium marinum]MCW3806714.1 dinitrogenase iron-molybdenum cofactor biosynthesis protein [Plebeiobacterium marinum]